jgi:hypothetical protein
MEAWNIYWINKLLESISLTWDDVGLVLLENVKTKKYVVVESKYYKLNNIFESLLEQDPAAGTGESISSYLSKWITQYTRGMKQGDYGNDPDVKKLLAQVQQSYGKDSGKAALQQIASVIWSKSKSGQGAGGTLVKPSADTSSEPSAAPASQTPKPSISVKDIKAVIPGAPASLLKNLQSAISTELSRRGGSPE